VKPEVLPIKAKLEKVALADLHVRYIPVVTPIKIWDYDMSLVNSPHVELMTIFRDHGYNADRLVASRYYAERLHRKRVGMERWHEAKIWMHIGARYKIFRNIQARGYHASFDMKNPIKILKEPFWKTRYRCDEPFLKGWEIWNGAGRCSAAYVLGYTYVKAQMCQDQKPGSKIKGKFNSKLQSVEGVWDNR